MRRGSRLRRGTNVYVVSKRCQADESLEMTKLAIIFVAAGTLLCGTAISNAQDRERPHATVPQTEGMRRGEGPHDIDVDRDHRHRPIVIIVGAPIFAGPPYDSYYPAAPMDLYRTIDGFYYYCAEPAGYYPAVPDCPSGWRLVP
jgi:hypothetical protein